MFFVFIHILKLVMGCVPETQVSTLKIELVDFYPFFMSSSRKKYDFSRLPNLSRPCSSFL